MDKLIYVAMTGAAQAMQQQAVAAHNLANATTPGYRADRPAFQAIPLAGDGAPTRVYVADSAAGFDQRPGAVQQTGRELDVALEGQGWFAVQPEGGGEAYTRAGSFQVSANGVLQTRTGLNVLGDGGPITIPPDAAVAIAKDGTVSAVPNGNQRTNVQVVGRLKLVNPPPEAMSKGGDGLFRMKDGSEPASDPAVKVVGGALEGSNVNVVEEMVNMIQLARQFDMQMKLLQNAEGNSSHASQLLSTNR